MNLSAWRSGGFTPAARKLGVGGPGEPPGGAAGDRLQAKLLLRTTRQVRLTELGEIYFRHCRQLLDSLYEAELAVGAIRRCRKVPCASRPRSPYGESRIAPW